MKNLLILAGTVLASFSFIFCAQPGNPGQEPYSSAVKVSQSEWDNLTAEYKSANENLTLGGILNKTDLETMLSKLDVGCRLVQFRFITDTTYHQTSVAFSGGEPAKDVPCIRNGGSEDAFCPIACDLRSTASPSAVLLSFEDFKELSALYHRKNPEVSTLGGNIDKAALLAIIGSIPKEETNINFRFCKDPRYNKISVIFMGGSEGQPTGEILYLRNGESTESFCPTNCGLE